MNSTVVVCNLVKEEQIIGSQVEGNVLTFCLLATKFYILCWLQIFNVDRFDNFGSKYNHPYEKWIKFLDKLFFQAAFQ